MVAPPLPRQGERGGGGGGKKFKVFHPYVPSDELGVLGLFVQVAKRLGYNILYISDRFPDLLPEDLTTGNTVMAEVELHSSNYKAHDHPQDGRTVIVCWEHNWPETTQPVIELRSLIELPDLVSGDFKYRIERRQN